MRVHVVSAVVMVSSLLASLGHASLIAHWRFDEGSGTVAFDATGSFDGNLQGSASFVGGGISGGAISLQRTTGDLVNMGQVLDLTSGDFSVSFWVKTDTQDPDTFAVSKHQSGSGNGYFVFLNSTYIFGQADKSSFYYSGGTTVSTTTVNDDTWHHIVAVYNDGGNAEIYVDGVPVEDSQPAVPIIGNAADFLVGGLSYGGTPTGNFTGLIDDVQVYNHALSAVEVQLVFHDPGLFGNSVFFDGFELGGTSAWSFTEP